MVKKPAANAGDMKDRGLIPGSGRFPGEGNTLVFLPGEPHGQRTRWAVFHGVTRNWTQLTEVT